MANIFDVKTIDPKEHFLLSIILGTLKQFSDKDSEDGFVKTTKVYERVQGLGFTPEQIDVALSRGYWRKLFETAAGRIPQPGLEMPQTIRITTVGAYHIEKLAKMFTYIDAVVVDTPVLTTSYREEIHNEMFVAGRLRRARIFKKYLDESWGALGDAGASTFFDWPQSSNELHKEIEIISRAIQN